MNREDQQQFVRELSNNVVREIESEIAAGKIPAHWNGIQLRQLLAERFAASVMLSDDHRTALRQKNAYDKEAREAGL